MNTDRLVALKQPLAIVVLGTAACLVASLVLHYLLLIPDGVGAGQRALIGAVLLPVVLGIPVFGFVALTLSELRRARSQLNRAATYDPATDCYNATVFSTVVERRRIASAEGALLVVDASALRSISLRYGPAWAEEAMRIIAAAIREAVREGDVVGRLGGSEFGVYLAGATAKDARNIGVRIRSEVAAAVFSPEPEEAAALSVTVGGVMVRDQRHFEEMFRVAARQVDDARQAEIEGVLIASTRGAKAGRGTLRPN